ncbi:MAG: efflux transporter outer membrane subunit [Chlamydiales bacterium]|nr:efflux transporter outer membrane subunit [Chlamydiales bacterium]
MLRTVAALLSLLCISGCRSSCWVDPICVPSSALSEAISAVSCDTAFDPVDEIPSEWWIIFGDEQLNDCIERTLCRHPSAQAARLQIFAAKYRSDLARSRLNPTVTAIGSITSQKLSETSLVPFGPSFVTPNQVPLHFTEYDLHLNLLYDFDLWGKTRQMVMASVGDAYARVADEALARLNLSLAVADAYFKLQIAYQRAEFAEELVACRRANLDLIEQRVTSGVDSCFMLANAQNGLSQAEQMHIQFCAEVSIQEHQLQSYIGESFDECIPNIEVMRRPLPSVPLPVDLPLHLLARRPDIQSQLWMIQAAGHQIKSARARFYPDINLLGMIGYQTIHWNEWFQPNSVDYSVGPAISLPLYDPAAGVANLRGREVEYDLAVTQYNQLVLNATKEVLDGITTVQATSKQLEHSQYQCDNVRSMLECIESRLQSNLASRVDVLATEERLILTCDQQALMLGNTLQSILSLVKALGGGYHADCIGDCDGE